MGIDLTEIEKKKVFTSEMTINKFYWQPIMWWKIELQCTNWSSSTKFSHINSFYLNQSKSTENRVVPCRIIHVVGIITRGHALHIYIPYQLHKCVWVDFHTFPKYHKYYFNTVFFCEVRKQKYTLVQLVLYIVHFNHYVVFVFILFITSICTTMHS